MQDKKNQLSSSLDKFIDAPYLFESEDPKTQRIVNELDIEQDNVVLEFGAGDGYFTLPIAKKLASLGDRGIVFGFDYSHTLVNRLNERAANNGLDLVVRAKHLAYNDPYNLAINDSSIDRIVSINSAHYLKNPLSVYEEFNRILKPGGILLLSDWQRSIQKTFGVIKKEFVAPEQVLFDLMVAGFHPPAHIKVPGFSWIIRTHRLLN